MCFVISGCVATLCLRYPWLSCKRYMLSMHSLLSMTMDKRIYSVCNHITLMWYIFSFKNHLGCQNVTSFYAIRDAFNLYFSSCLLLEGGIGVLFLYIVIPLIVPGPGPNMAAICSCPLPQMVPQDSLVNSHVHAMHVMLWMIFISYLI